MSETTLDSTPTRNTHSDGFTRVYTTPGVHPYDEVTWVRRDVVQNNWKTGEVVFEQSNVEFPDFWSLNAVTIVATKYFRGAVGTDAREWSLKQVIDRVVLTYTKAGKEHGYFTSDEDAEIFEHELTYMLLHQVFAFNSPVWFNVGTSAPQQVSACQPFHAPVATENGYLPIGQIVENNMVGLKVRTADGLAQVLAVKNNGVKDVYRVTLKSGHTVEATSDHVVWTGRRHEGAWKQVSELRVGDMMTWHRPQAPLSDDAPLGAAEYEAALVGWLMTDGFVGQYATGTNRSLTVEPHTVNDEEAAWVVAALDAVLPNVHRKVRGSETVDPNVDFVRYRMYGEVLRPFVEKWGLLKRGVNMQHPTYFDTAPVSEVRAYLQSIFQADGYVSLRERSALVGVSMESEDVIRGVQRLLDRFGIFSRRHTYPDSRDGRNDRHVLLIQNRGDRVRFAELVGFISSDKQQALLDSLTIPGREARDVKTLSVASIENLGPQTVYDIQTDAEEYLSGNVRVHNCFILSVDDTMDSILNWYKEEGFIFKGGSGAGLNLSRIRSSKELLRSSGGTASGPVSFMRGADASAGTIKSGGATRRAAKMVVLDVDHPDIEEFIETKVREEDKIRVLRDAGYDMDLGGQDITSVQYQNANNSVRVSDEFMRAVEGDADFGLKARTDGEVIETVNAKQLFRTMAEAAWACADPGIQYDDTINDWHTNPETGRINASNPCSEYMSLDNSSCNLASLNLMKFLKDDGTFDAETFAKAVEFVITAMDISICFADFPTEAIGDTTRRFRQLGIGYANLGALLMATGLPYDSDAGRAFAAAITSLMTGTAYKRSAELAGVVGPYDGYARNEDAHKRVMRKHAAANDNVRSVSDLDGDVLRLAVKTWEECLQIGEENGWRNAQASVLAPTGTIGFMMDCDTTGIEPDFSLVKFKKLVGGGSMQIVNQTIPRALRKLGYTEETIEAIVEYISDNGHVIDAPGLKTEHYAIFDTAMGARAISPMGHVRMMAACQPFLSGAISKTVNMPESATVEEVEEIYYEGWKQGLKALAIYRDNCKVGQPLSDGKEAKKDTSSKSANEAPVRVEYVEVPTRTKLPRKRVSHTTSFDVQGTEGYLTTGEYDDGRLGEVFVKMSKQGSTLAGLIDAFSIAVSIGLQYGVPLESFVEKFVGTRFEPAGITDDPDVRFSQSVVDYIFRRLALDYLPEESREMFGIYTAAERIAHLNNPHNGHDADTPAEEGSRAPVSPVDRETEPADASGLADTPAPRTADAPMCSTCGHSEAMVRSGACWACRDCGTTTGCS